MSKTVVFVKLHTVTFDEEEGYKSNDQMIQEALHNVAENVRSATEYTEFGYEENFEAILVVDDDEDWSIVQAKAAKALKGEPHAY